jgi:uncharacterized protein (TIGR03437 family)
MGASSVLKRTLLIVAAALLPLASGMAQIQVDNQTSETVVLTGSQRFQNISVTSASSSAITFTVAVAEQDLPSIQWLSATPTSGTTPATLSLQIVQDLASQGTGPFTATVTLTGGGSAATINVQYQPGPGGATGTPVTPSSLTVNVPSGGSASNQINLQNNTGGPISITAVSTGTSDGNPWLSASAATGQTILAGSTGIIAVTTTAGSLPPNTYNGTITIVISGSPAVSVPVTFTVGATGLTVSSTNLGLTYSNGTSQSQNVSVSGITNYNASATTQTGGNWLVLTADSQTGTTITSAPAASSVLTVSVAQAAASQLTTGTYSGTITVSNSANTNTSVTISVTLSVNISAATSLTVNPTSLGFYYQTGGMLPPPQTLVLTAPASEFSATVTSGGSWLFLGASGGTIPTNLSVNIAGTLPDITSTGNIHLAAGALTAVTQDIPVTINITANPVAYASDNGNGTVVFNTAASQAVTIYASDASSVTVQGITAPNWLNVTQSGNTLTMIPNLSQASSTGPLSGVVMATVVNSANTIANSPISIPVVLVLNSGSTGTLTISPSSLSFQSSASGVSPSSATLSVSAASQTAFSVTTSCGSSTCSWLNVSPTGNLSTNQNLTITVNATGLVNNTTYSGTINFTTAAGLLQTVPVTLAVSGATTGGTISANQTSLSFNAITGGAAQSQMVTISSSGAQVSYTASSNAAWLTVSPASGLTQSSVTITANPSGLAPGNYTGTVTIAAGNTVGISVSLTVQAPPTISAGTTSLTFVSLAGGTAPAAQSVTISGATGGFTAAAAVSSSDTVNWLSVSPASGNAGTSITVSVTPTGLSVGQHTGTITITGTNGLTGAATIAVTLTVNPPLPSVTSVVNAASFLPGPIAPGEAITLFGSNIGPTTAVTAQIANGQLATQLGNVEVIVNGFLAPLIYASANQVSAVVPYEIAGQASAIVGVKYLGASSNFTTVAVAATNPGIFTQNSSGKGPAGFNGNFSVNGSANPAARGSTVVFFLTGEGQTIPSGVTGTINSSPTQNPSPAAPITILIGGQPATYSYAGGIEGVVEGIMQLNVQIPATAPSGADPLVITIGNNSTQSGVTISVQ